MVRQEQYLTFYSILEFRFFFVKGVMSELIILPNNTTKTLIVCLSPNENILIQNHYFMIIRQISRLIIYYLMPLICISTFYILIAKTLFQAKDDVIYFRNTSSIGSNNNNNNDENRKISATMSNNREIFISNQEKRTRKQILARHKVAKVVLFLCLVFFLCWLPKQIHDLYW